MFIKKFYSRKKKKRYMFPIINLTNVFQNFSSQLYVRAIKLKKSLRENSKPVGWKHILVHCREFILYTKTFYEATLVWRCVRCASSRIA